MEMRSAGAAPLISAQRLLTAKAPPKESADSPKETFAPGDEQKVSEWATFSPLRKIGTTAISAWWGLALGGSALLATTALAPAVAAGIGVTAGVAIMQAATRMTKSDTSKAELEAKKKQRSQEPSEWTSSSLLDKAKALGISGWIGGSVLGLGLGLTGFLAPAAAIALGAGVGMGIGAGSMAISKPSGGSGSSGDDISPGDSGGIGMTNDGKLGLNLGSGVIMGSDGKIGFGFKTLD